MQSIYVRWLDQIDFQRTEARQYDPLPDAPIVSSGSRSFAREMLGRVSLEEVLHRWRSSDRLGGPQLGLQLVERIDPGVDLPAQRLCLFTCRGRRPDREAADGHPPLTAVDHIVKDEGPDIFSGDANPKARNIGIIGDDGAGWRDGEGADRSIGEMRCRTPRHFNPYISTSLCPTHVRLFSMYQCLRLTASDSEVEARGAEKRDCLRDQKKYVALPDDYQMVAYSLIT